MTDPRNSADVLVPPSVSGESYADTTVEHRSALDARSAIHARIGWRGHQKNQSTHPDFHQWYRQPGEDVWFRVVDYRKRGDPVPDRKTFIRFENTPGIPTSEVYCQLKI